MKRANDSLILSVQCYMLPGKHWWNWSNDTMRLCCNKGLSGYKCVIGEASALIILWLLIKALAKVDLEMDMARNGDAVLNLPFFCRELQDWGQPWQTDRQLLLLSLSATVAPYGFFFLIATEDAEWKAPSKASSYPPKNVGMNMKIKAAISTQVKPCTL